MKKISSFDAGSLQTPIKRIIENNEEEKYALSLELLSSTSSLLPLHSETAVKPHEDLECYFLSLHKQLVPTSDAKRFWTEAHYISCLRQLSLCSTPSKTKLDMRWDDSAFPTSSTCVNESFGLILHNPATSYDETTDDENNLIESKPIYLLQSDKITTSASSLLSITTALSNLSFTKSSSRDEQSQIQRASMVIGKLASTKYENSNGFTTFTPAKRDTRGTPSRSAFEKITNTPKKLASAFARGLTGGITSILASYDIVDDPAYYNDANASFSEDPPSPITTADYERQLHQKEQQLLELNQLVSAGDEDILINVELAAECSLLLLHYIGSFDLEESSDLNDEVCNKFVLVQNKVMVYRDGCENESSPVWTKFCHHVGQYYQSINTHKCNTRNPLFKSWTWHNAAQAQLLSQINVSDANILASALLFISAIHTNSKNNILYFSIDSALTKIEANETETLSLVEEALFDLTCTQQSLLTKIENTERDIEKDKQKAIHYQKKKKLKLALVQLQKRKMRQSQLDRYSGTLLNIEMAMESLYRSLSDLDIKDTLQTYHDTMKEMREINDYNIDSVGELMEDLKEESDNMQDVGALMAKEIGSFGSDIVDNIDLEKELKELEEEMKENTDNGKGGNDNGDSGEKSFVGKENILSLEERLKNLSKPNTEKSMISQKPSKKALSAV